MPSLSISIVVPARDRPTRLRWLLNALADQSLDRSLWEVIVAHQPGDPERDRLLAEHPLAGSGRLRAVPVPRTTIAAMRNAGWRAARGPSILFADETSRPPEGWLTAVHDQIGTAPGVIIQGPTEGDPDELAMRHAPFWRTRATDHTLTAWPAATNIVYPRELLERLGGFSEDLAGGEDIELAGEERVVRDAILTFQSVDDRSLTPWLSAARELRDLALVFKRHPELRRGLYLGAFWKRSHAWLPLALAGLVLQRRRPLAIGLVVPWAVLWEPRHEGIRGRVRHLTELPGWAVVDSAELLSLARGSVRHRSVVL